jgi:hypothetical protein
VRDLSPKAELDMMVSVVCQVHPFSMDLLMRVDELFIVNWRINDEVLIDVKEHRLGQQEDNDKPKKPKPEYCGFGHIAPIYIPPTQP